MTREERIKFKVDSQQVYLSALLKERRDKGEFIGAFEALQYSACPHLAKLCVDLEDELHAVEARD